MTDRLPAKHVLMCPGCGRVRSTTPEQQLTYMSRGWPKCCKEVMVLYIEAEKAKDNGKARKPTEL